MLETFRRYLKYTSWPIIAAMLTLLAIGIVSIRCSEKVDPSLQGHSAKQMAFACAGLICFVIFTVIPYRRIGQYAYAIFGATLVVLVMLLLPRYIGSNGLIDSVMPEIRGARRWINMGPVKLQPSEIAKLSFIILLAWYLRFGDHYRHFRGLAVSFILTIVPMGLILKEPDLGTALLFLPTLYFMLFMAGARMKHLLTVVVVATVLVLLPIPQKQSNLSGQKAKLLPSVAYFTFGSDENKYIVTAAPLAVMEQHQIERIVGWLRQDSPEISGNMGYQLYHSKMVLGSGQMSGRGGMEEGNYYIRMLPDDHTDFIFSVIGGQWGFLGCMAVLFLYGVIFVFGVEIATITYDPFARLLAVGVLALLFSQLFINVGMTMGLMPITGMTLPMISYGGTSLVINCIALGLLINVGQRRPILLAKRPFEYGPKRQKLMPAEKDNMVHRRNHKLKKVGAETGWGDTQP